VRWQPSGILGDAVPETLILSIIVVISFMLSHANRHRIGPAGAEIQLRARRASVAETEPKPRLDPEDSRTLANTQASGSAEAGTLASQFQPASSYAVTPIFASPVCGLRCHLLPSSRSFSSHLTASEPKASSKQRSGRVHSALPHSSHPSLASRVITTGTKHLTITHRRESHQSPSITSQLPSPQRHTSGEHSRSPAAPPMRQRI